jgi:enamine deaminase RidA (YjgF/YER057c/UK114 family)
MVLECVNPEGLESPSTFSHVVIAKGAKLVFIAGQVAIDESGDLVGGADMAAQARQVFANLGLALAAAGAQPDQVAKLTIFVANYQREHLAMIEQGRIALFGAHKPADTLVGVACLSRPDYMLEIDAIAIID